MAVINENFLNDFAEASPGDGVIYHEGPTLWFNFVEDGTVKHRRYPAANEAWDLHVKRRAILTQRPLGKASTPDRHFQYIAIKRKG